jgi:hypothetical protein
MSTIQQRRLRGLRQRLSLVETVIADLERLEKLRERRVRASALTVFSGPRVRLSAFELSKRPRTLRPTAG